MEVAGLTFSVVGLLDTCLTASRLYSSAKNFSRDSESLVVGLLWQQSRLRSWGKAWRIPIDCGGGTQSTDAPQPQAVAPGALLEQEVRERNLDPTVIYRTLESMKSLLSEGEKLAGRHQEDADVEKGLSDKMKDARRRFRWVFTDMERLSHVVESLRSHNDSLWQIMPRAEASSPASYQIAATCEAMSTIAALGLTLPQAANEIAPPPLGQTLSMMARRDVVEGISAGTNPDIDLAFHEWKGKVSAYDGRGRANVDLSGISSGRQIAMYIKGHGKFRQDLDVMIEWKRYGAKAAAQSMALERTDRVARLLSSASLPEDLRILKCVGYFHNPDRRCCGVLFQLPEALAGKGASTQAVTLAEELSNPYYASLGGGPSLADRLHLGAALARAVLKLHLSRWLHKDLRSDNIVFFKQRSRHDGVDFGYPYIASFGFARPDQWLLDSESEYAPRDDGSLLAYCHPDYQHSTERLPEPASGVTQHAQPPSRRPRYHAAFDVYGLGCVLLEIGLWQSLESLGWKTHRENKGADKREEWRDKLVRRAQRQLGFLCGAAYRDVVVKCLSTTLGQDGFKEDDSERVRDFCWTIMRVLENLRV